MVVFKTGVVNGDPEKSTELEVASAYHLTSVTVASPVAVKSNVPVPQRVAPAEAVILYVNVIGLLVE